MQNANAGLAPRAAVIDLDEQITAENSANTTNGQDVALADARRRLLALIRHRPAPQPEVDLFDMHRWRRDSRRVTAAQWLRSIRSTRHVAEALGCTPRCVNYWRVGHCAPTVKHWRQLRALHALLLNTST